VVVDDRTVKTRIWDTAGQEAYHSITAPYFRNARGVLLFFDLSERGSFQSLDYWLTFIHENANTPPAIVLIGNKCDLPHREIPGTEIEKFCETHGLQYFEVSAKANIRVGSALEGLVDLILGGEAPPDVVPIDRLELNEEKSCCSVA
jgi:small GTP-binding protein